MSAPALADLPKIPSDIADAVTGKVELKKVETQEKNVLPSKEDLSTERTHAQLISGIENFSACQLRKADTEEKHVLPSPADISSEKQHQQRIAEIEQFSAGTLKTVETEEKGVLPSKEDIAREKTVGMAASFDKSALKHVEPNVKNDVVVADA